MDKWRYHPAILELGQIAKSGILGRPVGLRTIRVQPDNRHEEDATWVLDPVPGQPDASPTEARITLTTCQDLFHSPDRSIGFGHLQSKKNKG